ncbi:MAG: RusA family crossover junction endodeoxyribonuclease [Candidatus Bathyarchaeota archaeon]|nr:MAG: RusA family crossover junction endodeoxyribonuclease [Candidatus Bathyarchaeota archaeon]
MRRVEFEVVGQPVPKSRPRVVTKGKRRFAYTPKKVKDWEDAVREEAAKHFERPFAWPVVVSMTFYMPRPKSRRLDFWVPTVPDLDNLEKSVLDALNEVAYSDDRLVVVKSSSKRYVQDGEPRVRVTVTSISDQRSLTEYGS